MKKLIVGLVLALAGFGLTFINSPITTVIGFAMMLVGVVLFFWSLAQARSRRKQGK